MNPALTMPPTVANFVQSINGHDAARFLASFSEEALVVDVGREFRGKDAIKEWGDREIFAANVTLEVADVADREGKTVLTVKVDGDFDRTGLPDPLFLEQIFALEGGKIAALTCQLPA